MREEIVIVSKVEHEGESRVKNVSRERGLDSQVDAR